MRLAILSTHRLQRELLAELLREEPDLEVVLTASDVDDGLPSAYQPMVDVVVLLAGSRDVPLVANIGSLAGVRTIVVWSSPGVPQPDPPPDVVLGPGDTLAGLLRVLRREHSPVARVATLEPTSAHPGRRSLTGREVDVLRLVASGMSAEEVARELAISAKTVQNYKQRIFAKLSVQSQTQAVARAMRTGLIAAGRHPTRTTSDRP